MTDNQQRDETARESTWVCMECGARYRMVDNDGKWKCGNCGTLLLKESWNRVDAPHLRVLTSERSVDR